MTSQARLHFYRTADRFIQWLLEEMPVTATGLGDHRYDHRLGDYGKEAIEERNRWAAAYEVEFDGIDTAELDREARIDQEIVVRALRHSRRHYEVVRSHERDPGGYAQIALGGVYLLLVGQFAPLEERLRNALGRLREVPGVLDQGRENIAPEDVPPLWAEMAIESAQQGTGLFTALLPRIAAEVPSLQADLAEAGRSAADALHAYAEFVKGEVLPRARGEFAAGETLFNELLRDNHMLDISAAELLRTGHRLFEETKREMEDCAAEIDPARSARSLLEEAKADHPPAEDLLDVYRSEVARVRRFVVDREIASIPDGESLRVEPTPAFLAPVLPYAAYMPPGPLEKKQEGIFLVTPVDPSAPPEVREDRLKGHHYAKLPITVLHEAYPGHHLQLTVANTVGSLPRKMGAFLSSLFIEGWAFYCEELMERLGYISSPIQRLGRLDDQLWRAARIIIDVSLHTGDMTVDRAVDFLVGEVGLERSSAVAEVKRYTMSPTQPMSYLIGKLEIMKLIEEYKGRHPTHSMREVHDSVLAAGSLPPRLLRLHLFGD